VFHREERASDLFLIRRALQEKRIENALKIFSPWFEAANKKAARRIPFNKLPGAAVKEICSALGYDGVPNIPLVRRLNGAQVNSYMERLSKSDEFLAEKGLQHLDTSEVVE
jgi:hypothetical protein